MTIVRSFVFALKYEKFEKYHKNIAAQSYLYWRGREEQCDRG